MTEPSTLDLEQLATVTGGLFAGGPGCVIREPRFPKDPPPKTPWPRGTPIDIAPIPNAPIS